MKCPLCGFEFEAGAAVCHPACPLKSACNFVCCPRCGYQSIDPARASSVQFIERIRRLYDRRNDSQARG